MTIEELQKYVKDKPKILIYGARQNFKGIKLAKLKEVFLASDCSKEIKEKIAEYSKFSDLKVDILPQGKEELALICKKNFPVSIVGVLSSK